MLHYHVIVKGETRTKGALTTTEAAARAEEAIERAGGRETDIEQCSQACFSEKQPA